MSAILVMYGTVMSHPFIYISIYFCLGHVQLPHIYLDYISWSFGTTEPISELCTENRVLVNWLRQDQKLWQGSLSMDDNLLHGKKSVLWCSSVRIVALGRGLSARLA